MDKVLIKVVFALFPVWSFAQQNSFLSDSMYECVFEEVNSIDAEMFNKGMDTSLFDFIPILIAELKFFKSSHLCDSFLKADAITLSEILLISKKNQKIAGSFRRCTDGSGAFLYTSNKYGISTIPCRKSKRFPYVSYENYNEVSHISKQSKIFFIVYIPDFNKIYMVTRSKKIRDVFDSPTLKTPKKIIHRRFKSKH